MSVHWYPGHMAKAFRLIENEVKKVDFVIECRDARAPLSSRNPVLGDKIANKPKLILLLKKDLADPNESQKWLKHLKDEGNYVLLLDTLKDPVPKLLISEIDKMMQFKREREKRRGMKRRPDRALIVGVPNVGKSTLINQLSKRKAAAVENRPGVTQALKLIQVNQYLDLVDTPGVLWPKFDTKEMGLHCALVGSVKDTGFDYHTVLDYALEKQGHDPQTFLEKFALEKGLLGKDGQADITKASERYLNELQNGKHGRITWDKL
ncbi:MAG TPA: ribosome biogenesis GTPase YlqF [Erysipelothrix sp.]